MVRADLTEGSFEQRPEWALSGGEFREAGTATTKASGSREGLGPVLLTWGALRSLISVMPWGELFIF